MKDPQREDWSRHYDTIQWTVITIFTAGVGALAAVSLSQALPASPWPDAAGIGLIVLGLFYVASFRSFVPQDAARTD